MSLPFLTGIRRAPVRTAVVAAGLAAATVMSGPALAAPARPSMPLFILRGMTAGMITTVQPGQTLTFVFTESNLGPGSAIEDLVVRHVARATVTGSSPCVLPDGTAIEPDGPSCEPGRLKPGQFASTVITTQVTGSSGQRAAVRVCLDNETTGVLGPCRTISALIA